jgi:hypothetical protein
VTDNDKVNRGDDQDELFEASTQLIPVNCRYCGRLVAEFRQVREPISGALLLGISEPPNSPGPRAMIVWLTEEEWQAAWGSRTVFRAHCPEDGGLRFPRADLEGRLVQARRPGSKKPAAIQATRPR